MKGVCKVCGKEVEGNEPFCTLHLEARRKVLQGYDRWRRAFSGRLTFREYLERLRAAPGTGRASLEVIEHLVAEGPAFEG